MSDGKENGESRRKMKVRDEIETQIEQLEADAEQFRAFAKEKQFIAESLRWVIGDGDLPVTFDAQA